MWKVRVILRNKLREMWKEMIMEQFLQDFGKPTKNSVMISGL
jgi:hypothetical protein